MPFTVHTIEGTGLSRKIVVQEGLPSTYLIEESAKANAASPRPVGVRAFAYQAEGSSSPIWYSADAAHGSTTYAEAFAELQQPIEVKRVVVIYQEEEVCSVCGFGFYSREEALACCEREEQP